MLKWFQKLFNSQIQKKSFAGRIDSFDSTYFEINPLQLVDEGYIKNCITFMCINKIAVAASNIPIELYKNKKFLDDANDKFYKLIENPSISFSFQKLIEASLINYLIYGNAYLERVIGYRKDIIELNLVPAGEVNIFESMQSHYLPDSYSWSNHGQLKKYMVDQITGDCDLFHIKEYNPKSLIKGLSKLEAAGYSVDIHNLAMAWNKALLKNSARPSGVASTDQILGDDSWNALKKQFEKIYSGSSNAGRPIILDSGLRWQTSGLSPLEMDFNKSLDTAARQIGGIFGVPFPLIITEASTYNNVKSAKEEFYIDTVIPLLESFLKSLSKFLGFEKEGYEFKLNLDSVSALSERRQARFKNMLDSVDKGILTIDEAREELGYEPMGGMAAELIIPTNRTPLDSSFSPTNELQKMNALMANQNQNN